MFSFLDTRHPFVKHIHSLIDHYGIDQYGAIRGTTYKFIAVSSYWSEWLLHDWWVLVLSYKMEWYTWSEALFIRAQKLIEDEAIQQRINSDIEKYLTSHSPLHEAMQDLKQINYHKDEIIKLSKKWQDAITNIHK